MASAVGRLKRRAEFVRVAGSGRKWVAPGLILQARPRGRRSETVEPRVGFTASRKIGGAVARNRARRRLRAVAENVMRGHATGRHDYVVIARRATLDRPFADLVNDLETALKRLNLYREGGERPVSQSLPRNGTA